MLNLCLLEAWRSVVASRPDNSLISTTARGAGAVPFYILTGPHFTRPLWSCRVVSHTDIPLYEQWSTHRQPTQRPTTSDYTAVTVSSSHLPVITYISSVYCSRPASRNCAGKDEEASL